VLRLRPSVLKTAPMKATIAVLAGDGIGPEVTAQGVSVLQGVAAKFGHHIEFVPGLIGGCAIDQTGSPLPEKTKALCRSADAILLGAVGGPKWDDPNAPVRPEQGLFEIRKELQLYANLRPVATHPKLTHASTLRPEILRGVDLLVVRELTGGLYYGEKKKGTDSASDLCAYTGDEVRRVVRRAAALARGRRKKLTSVDKANALETSRLWRRVTTEVVRKEFPDVALEHVLVDACAMYLMRRPASFDVIVTENMFGDILTDEASVLAGSMGLLPSASLGEGKVGLYEPIHGSAPDIAGQGIANPYATILSAAMLLRHSLGLEEEAAAVEKAVGVAIEHGVLTADVAPAGVKAASTVEAGQAVVAAL
jgi:3-isopropylmalate dehydrogenase